MAAIQRVVLDGSDAAVLADPGSAMAWAPHLLRVRDPRRWRLAGRFASMGQATAGVIGAAVARRRPALCSRRRFAPDDERDLDGRHVQLARLLHVLNDARYGMAAKGMAFAGHDPAPAAFAPCDSSASRAGWAATVSESKRRRRSTMRAPGAGVGGSLRRRRRRRSRADGTVRFAAALARALEGPLMEPGRLPLAGDEQIRAAGLLEPPDRVRAAGPPAHSLLGTIAHAGPVAASWLSFSTALLADGALPGSLRELAILRVAWRTQSEYVWGGHAAMAAAAGLRAAELAADAGDGAASETEAAVLRACDELLDTGTIADPTWDVLAVTLLPAELVELVLIVGNYRTVAWLDAVFDLRPEPGLPPLPPAAG